MQLGGPHELRLASTWVDFALAELDLSLGRVGGGGRSVLGARPPAGRERRARPRPVAGSRARRGEAASGRPVRAPDMTLPPTWTGPGARTSRGRSPGRRGSRACSPRMPPSTSPSPGPALARRARLTCSRRRAPGWCSASGSVGCAVGARLACSCGPRSSLRAAGARAWAEVAAERAAGDRAVGPPPRPGAGHRPDPARAADRAAARRRPHHPGGRGRPVRQPEDGGVPPASRVHQARHQLARRARRPPARPRPLTRTTRRHTPPPAPGHHPFRATRGATRNPGHPHDTHRATRGATRNPGRPHDTAPRDARRDAPTLVVRTTPTARRAARRATLVVPHDTHCATRGATRRKGGVV